MNGKKKIKRQMKNGEKIWQRINFPNASQEQLLINEKNQQSYGRNFPGGAVVKNLPANAGNTDVIPGPGRSHMPWSN